MKFYKLQAFGNDFVVIFNDLDKEQVLKICHPKFGIGCDQLFILEGEDNVKIYNNDGSDVSFCGNGLRALAYLQSKRCGRNIFEFNVCDVRYNLRVLDNNLVRLKINRAPIFITVNSALNQLLNGITNVIAFNIIDIGNKNLAIFFDKDDNIDFFAIKSQISNLGIFLDDLNMSFNIVLPNGNIKSRVIERGAGETLSCGSGALSTVISAVKNGLVPLGTVNVEQPGGALIHEISGDYQLYQTGESHIVFEGEYYP